MIEGIYKGIISALISLLGILGALGGQVQAQFLGANSELLEVKDRITGVRQFTKTENNCVTIPGRTIISSTSTNRVEESYTKCNKRQVAMVEYKFYSAAESAPLVSAPGKEVFRDEMSVHYRKGDTITAIFDSPKPKFEKVNGEWRDLEYKKIDQATYEVTVAPIAYLFGIGFVFADTETFNATGTFNPQVDDHTVLVVGGGGGGGGTGGTAVTAGGGGGAGGFVEQALTITAAQSITIGFGGNGFDAGDPGGAGERGATTSIGSLLERGGGGAGGFGDGSPGDGTIGRNGGGGGAGDTTGLGAPGLDFDGGDGFGSGNGTLRSGGGGGGATVAGGDGTSATRGSGGTGAESSLSGSEVTYSTGGEGSQSGDGDGAAGSANTGQGGVGGHGGVGGNGGSGIVIIQFTAPEADHFFPSFTKYLLPIRLASE